MLANLSSYDMNKSEQILKGIWSFEWFLSVFKIFLFASHKGYVCLQIFNFQSLK